MQRHHVLSVEDSQNVEDCDRTLEAKVVILTTLVGQAKQQDGIHRYGGRESACDQRVRAEVAPGVRIGSVRRIVTAQIRISVYGISGRPADLRRLMCPKTGCGHGTAQSESSSICRASSGSTCSNASCMRCSAAASVFYCSKCAR